MRHRLLRVVQRLFQYQVLLTGGPWGGRGSCRGGGREGRYAAVVE